MHELEFAHGFCHKKCMASPTSKGDGGGGGGGGARLKQGGANAPPLPPLNEILDWRY